MQRHQHQPQLLAFGLVLLFASASLCQAKRWHDDDGSFSSKIRKLRASARSEADKTRRLIESLDTIDDVELSTLRIPKRALHQVPVYGSSPAYGGTPAYGGASPAVAPLDVTPPPAITVPTADAQDAPNPTIQQASPPPAGATATASPPPFSPPPAGKGSSSYPPPTSTSSPTNAASALYAPATVLALSCLAAVLLSALLL